jgi:hypothetical protein
VLTRHVQAGSTTAELLRRRLRDGCDHGGKAARIVEGAWYGMSYQVATLPVLTARAKALNSGQRCPRSQHGAARFANGESHQIFFSR